MPCLPRLADGERATASRSTRSPPGRSRAVTYSEMSLERRDGGWYAYVVFDV
ncbi:hypothetical protein BN903_62 [Halorubrum sp. AJ67]|nr:hypothetical protein BN903_62 [Halorubrum sp. AJ67]